MLPPGKMVGGVGGGGGRWCFFGGVGGGVFLFLGWVIWTYSVGTDDLRLFLDFFQFEFGYAFLEAKQFHLSFFPSGLY